MGPSLTGKRVAVLGAGKMGGILLQSLIKSGMLSPDLTTATVQHPERARVLADKLHISVGTDNVAAIKGANIILICVKPQAVKEIVTTIAPPLTPAPFLISVAPSVP